MPNQKTIEMHALMTKNLANAEEYRRQLQAKQAEIDEQIEDVTRVILGVKRLITTLDPAVSVVKDTEVKMPEAQDEEFGFDRRFMSDMEKEMATRTAQ